MPIAANRTNDATRFASVLAEVTSISPPVLRRAQQAVAVLHHPQVVLDMAGAVARGRGRDALRMARTASRTPGKAEKIVSRKYRYLWICVPKVASRSIMAALRATEPDIAVICDKSIFELYKLHPPAESYTSFAFIRHPFDRALSLYAEMRYFRERFDGPHRYLKGQRQLYFERCFHGLAEVDSFNDYCQWLNTRYGSDAFADAHFLSQHLQMRLADSRLPDFIGRLEAIDEDFERIVAQIGLPATALPQLNTMLGWQASSPPALQQARAEMRALLTPNNKALLRRRYAADLQLYEAVAAK